MLTDPLTTEEHAVLAAMVARDGEVRTAAALRVDRAVVLRLLANRPTRRATLALVRARLREIEAAEQVEPPQAA